MKKRGPAAKRAGRRNLVRAVQAPGVHRAFCRAWARTRGPGLWAPFALRRVAPCAECDRLQALADAARCELGLGPRGKS